jgi:hypothetical protein
MAIAFSSSLKRLKIFSLTTENLANILEQMRVAVKHYFSAVERDGR